jgi:hypothetical protein
MKKPLYIIILIACLSCEDRPKNIEQKTTGIHQEDYWRQLEYLIHLKNDVARGSWKKFSEKDFFAPAVYYTMDGTYVLNPNEHIQRITDYQPIKSLEPVKAIKLSEKYTDTTNFNFSTSYSDSDSTVLYYQQNVLFFQSFDLTKKLIGVDDMQDWSIMVIHELYHGYQRSIPGFKAYYSNLDIPGGPDEFLAKYYKELDWFKASVQRENEILKSIWIDGADLVSSLNTYDSLRSARIEKIKATYGIDIREIEDYEILLEGHARYFESLCKRHLSEMYSDRSMLTEQDTPFITNMFEGYEIKKDKGLYDLYNDRYYYQLGYNISMILEKYLPDYKETLYVEEHNFNRYLDALKAHNQNQ